jgi:hypothetical protein
MSLNGTASVGYWMPFDPPGLQPQIGSFTASPNLNVVTLTAWNITDRNPNSTVLQVYFYLNGTLLGPGNQSSPGIWTFLFSTNGWGSGSYTLTARAEDSLGVFSDPLALTLTVQ